MRGQMLDILKKNLGKIQASTMIRLSDYDKKRVYTAKGEGDLYTQLSNFQIYVEKKLQ